MGFLSGLVNLERGGVSPTKCDLLAADPYDPLRRAPGLTLDKVDTAAAEKECRAEHESHPDDGRTTYQLARVISADTNREAEYVSLAREAAARGVSPAFSLVAYALSQKDDTARLRCLCRDDAAHAARILPGALSLPRRACRHAA